MPTPFYPSRWLINSADLSDDPDIFPYLPGQQFLQKKTPLWSTATTTAVSGRDRRRALWSYPLWKFEVSYDMLRHTPSYPELDKLNAFFNSHSAGYQSWFYFDRTDNSCTDSQFGEGDGSTTTFQLSRTKTFGGITFTEPVRGVSGIPDVYINGIITTSYTIGAYGSITFSTPPAAAAILSWTGNFFFLCRFVEDELDISSFADKFWEGSGIEFRTIKP